MSVEITALLAGWSPLNLPSDIGILPFCLYPCFEFSECDTHSRLSALLSSLRPFLWLTTKPSQNPVQNAFATILWALYFLPYTFIWRYPVDLHLNGFTLVPLIIFLYGLCLVDVTVTSLVIDLKFPLLLTWNPFDIYPNLNHNSSIR